MSEPTGDMDKHGNLVDILGDHVISHELQPGQTCEACKRKIPHPKKPSSPTTKPVSYRVPLDEVQAHQETLEAAAHFVGVAEQPFSHFKVYTLALALLLQDEGLRGYGYRA
jgi:hypothetical protein